MEKILAQIDKDLVHFYNDLLLSQTRKGNEFKSEFLNSLISFYFGNKQLFVNAPISLKKHFNSEHKSVLSMSLNEINGQLFTFFYEANNRSKKQEAEFILTCLLLTLKSKKVEKIKFSEEEGMKFYKNKRVFSLTSI